MGVSGTVSKLLDKHRFTYTNITNIQQITSVFKLYHKQFCDIAPVRDSHRSLLAGIARYP